QPYIPSWPMRLQDVTLMYLTVLATLVVILVASYQSTPTSTSTPVQLPYHMPLDPRGHLQLSWNISYPLQELYLEVRCSEMKHGLVLGMSDRGELTNADLVVLWDDGHQSFFGDAWSDSQGRVSLDSQQDYQLMDTRQTPEGFSLLFKRPFSTCDPRDYIIEVRDRERLREAHRGRGSGVPKKVQSPGPQIQIPSRHFCPRYESVVTPGNEAIVHHMEVFECSPEMSTVPQYSGSCDSKMKPASLNYCRHVLAAWAMGAKSFYYPTDAGLPLGGPASSRFLRLEVHYHNPLLISGRKDNSGVRLYHTPSLRRYDAGIMELGLVYTPVMAIPPREKNFHLTGFCTSKCTQTALPPGGINIFASQLHTHLAGRGVRTVLVRGGKEVKVVQEDKHFSTHYQVTPLGTCFGIMEEMCVNYVHYYPRTQLELCKSNVDPGYLQKYFSFINRFQGGDACSCGQTSVMDQFSSLSWDSFSGEVLNSLYNTAPISMACNQSSAKLFPVSIVQDSLVQVKYSYSIVQDSKVQL
uniref:Dopamine beta-hydroxylase n=1 Tax=Hucho hucho TaxID=62062 RepID=A0A4W5P690_9TELE